ncbi:MAG: hypothetical protein V3U80_05640 [Flavobacteriaceae bacterium]
MKNHKLVLITLLLLSHLAFSQNTENDVDETVKNNQENASQSMLKNKDAKKVTIGAYGQVDYNETEGSAKGKMDVHRMVLLFGYNFTDKIQFFTELEFEHVKEVYVEQAFLSYRANQNLAVKAGLMLVPMGIINEYHESPTFYGVERPSVDHDIVPTTWREIGVGVSGKFGDLPFKYQGYIFNGFKSDGLRGKDGLRKGRQKGANSVISSPTLSAKLDYYGIKGLRLGLSGYFGNTQTSGDEEAIGETIGVNMLGFDARYNYKNFKAAGQFITTSLSNTKDYNLVNTSNLGSKLQGWYLEAGYNVLAATKKEKLSPFVRYEQYDTHAKTDGFTANDAYNRQVTTFGINYQVAPGAVFKVDYQLKDDKTSNDVNNQFNAGIAIWL